jgi:hypothetical protein
MNLFIHPQNGKLGCNNRSVSSGRPQDESARNSLVFFASLILCFGEYREIKRGRMQMEGYFDLVRNQFWAMLIGPSV